MGTANPAQPSPKRKKFNSSQPKSKPKGDGRKRGGPPREKKEPAAPSSGKPSKGKGEDCPNLLPCLVASSAAPPSRGVTSTMTKPASFTEFLQQPDVSKARAMILKAGLNFDSAVNLGRLPIGGRISKCPEAWQHITTDRWVLDIVHFGYKVQFLSTPHTPREAPNPRTGEEGRAILDKEVQAMLEKGAIRPVPCNKDGVVSPFFARPKPSSPGKFRPIISLKKVNNHIRKVKFRMVTVKDLRLWVREDYYFSSLDLQDAYFSIPLHSTVWRFCRFVWNDLTYEFMVNMFGLGPSARLFTKVLSAVVRYLRSTFCILIQGYIDDFLIQANTAALCKLHTHVAIILFHVLGFEVNFGKSSLTPAQHITHLGFEWDSVKMTITLPMAKVEKMVLRASDILLKGGCTADQLRSYLGTAESCRPAVEASALHYRSLQALLPPRVQWNGQQFLPLTPGARRDLVWWRDSLLTSRVAPLRRGPYTMTLATDASGLWGWGGHSPSRGFLQAPWRKEEVPWHINTKELVAAKNCLEAMVQPGDHVHLSMDSKTAVAFVNRQGGTRSTILCQVALQLWEALVRRQAWVTATWLPRDENQIADMLSKESLLTWEFGLRPRITETLWLKWFTPELDCFASSTFHSVEAYCSFYPDKKAVTRDAFSMFRWPARVYCFPPVPLITMTLERIKMDDAEAIMVVPYWPTAKWWDLLAELLQEPPLQLGFHSHLLLPLPGRKLPHLGSLVAVRLRRKSSHSSASRLRT